MRNRMYGGVRGRKTKVGEKLLRFPPTHGTEYFIPAYDSSHQKLLQSYYAEIENP